ncbi:uncharacterized protein LOC119369048 [Jatropha curcas]|uniref:uncharacterized protein LOC119369048 n=1 Tax=Jatropha curcas TaxID=180498 RepID=UPI0005FBF9C9|nr:uncharacterized protein LOC119369048 [Jatropha curcas]
MTRRSESPNGRTQSLLAEKPTETTKKLAKTKTTSKEGQGEKSSKSKRFGEVVGGTAAECAAVCCCCPCTLMNLLVLTIFKMPACLCRKVRNRLRKKKRREGLLAPTNNNTIRREELERELKAVTEKQKSVDGGDNDDGKTEALDLEKEMWDQFYASGFWRSPSQRQRQTQTHTV